MIPSEHWTADVLKANLQGLQETKKRLEGGKKTEVSNGNGATTVAEVEPVKWTAALWHYLRWALSGDMPGPSVVEIMEILGKGEVEKRLGVARRVLKERTAAGGEGANAAARASA